jgi:1-acyl-sn-glycerol-3-phosphate acyltransferase
MEPFTGTIVAAAGAATALALLAVAAVRARRFRRADWGVPWLNRLDGVNRWFCQRFHGLRADELPLPDGGGAIVVCNHVSGLDPLLMIAASPRPLRFVIAREEYERWWLRWLFRSLGFIPVDRHERPERAFRAARQALDAGEVVAMFPQGGIHRRRRPPPPLKRGAVRLARHAGVPLYVLRLSGIRGRGMTVAAVLIPAHARIEVMDAPLECRSVEEEDRCLALIDDWFRALDRHPREPDGRG